MTVSVALLCSGLGHVRRGHEVFARDLFDLLKNDLDITLFKGGGTSNAREQVVAHIPRASQSLAGMHLPVSAKWRDAAIEVERMRVEGETFAWGALGRLLEGNFDVIHCLEQEVCNVLWSQRHLFAQTPRLLWSNGGALPAADTPPCDFIQEHSTHNLQRSRRDKAFVIPHGVDLQRFYPQSGAAFRQHHGIPADAFVVITVGTICYWHKRTDHVVREVAAVPGAWLVAVGQEGPDTAAIKQLAQQLMPGRTVFTTMPHEALPQAYAAADVFTLGSLFETFGIVYIEAMAMGLPVVCTHHANQKDIVQHGVFIDMAQAGALTAALRDTPAQQWHELGKQGWRRVRECFDLAALKRQYIERYTTIAHTKVALPRYSAMDKVRNNAASLWRRAARRFG